MKKSLLALLIVLIAMMLCIPVSAQSNVTEFTSTDRTERSDDMDDDEYDDDYDDDDEYDDDSYDDDWSGYYNSFTYCQYLFDNYEADLEPYISGLFTDKYPKMEECAGSYSPRSSL